ncbi:RNA-processing protein [Candidatus Woesearchaeota archaeon]|nr:RNA-processing protein [Candidatus Woesearchaeota archaeon]
MYEDQLKINKDRIPILIGKNGSVKKQIEIKTQTKITIDSKEGDIFIRGNESYEVYIAKIIVLAISRGFNPDIALMLKNENTILEILDIKDYAGRSKTKIIRAKSRVIGTKGKSKKLIEQLTDTDVCVYGKTISIIGKVENAIMARRAVEMLLGGSKHGNVYSWLEKQQHHLREQKHLNNY